MVVLGSALWLCFGTGLLVGAGCAGDPCAGEGLPGGQAQLLRSQTGFVCLLSRGTCCREQQTLAVLEQTEQSRHSVVSSAAGGGFACRSRG